MNILLFLFLFSLIIAIALFLLRRESLRGIIVKVASAAISLGTLFLLAVNFRHEVSYHPAKFEAADTIIFILELAIAAYILWQRVRFKKYAVCFLILLQTALLIAFESIFGKNIVTTNNLLLDKFSMFIS